MSTSEKTRAYRYVCLEDIPAFLERGWVLDRPASPHSVFMWAPEDEDEAPQAAAELREQEDAA